MNEIFHEYEPRPKFSVDPHGAYLKELRDEAGEPILFTRTEIGGKTRGGCHVCLPNFGPDASGKLDQHGFGRQVDWQLESLDDAAAQLRMPHIEGEYAGLGATLNYGIDRDDEGLYMSMRLAVGNSGDKALRIAPAFHPYFAVNEEERVELNGERLDLAEYADAKFIEGTEHTLQIGKRRLRLHSSELTTWALWTDRKGGYFCVEPTLAGPSFQNERPDEVELLKPSEHKSYDFRIYWS